MTGDEPADLRSQDLPARWWLRLGHDLRAPIAPMRMALQLLRGGQATPREQQNALRILDRQFDQMLEQIDDLSDLARLNAGNFGSNPSPADLNLVLDIVGGKTSLVRRLEEK